MASVEQSITAELGPNPNRWRKGQSGNPLGALVSVRKPNLLHRLYRKLSADADVRRKIRGVVTSPGTVADEVINELVRLSLYAEDERVRMVAIKEILDRVDGKPLQSVTVNAPTDKRVQYLTCLQFVKDKMAEAGAELPSDAVLINGIAQTSGYEDIVTVLSDLFVVGEGEQG